MRGGKGAVGRPDQSLIPILEVVCLNQQTSGSNEFQKCENYLGQPGRFHKIHIVPMLHNIRINYINTMSQPKPEQPSIPNKEPQPSKDEICWRVGTVFSMASLHCRSSKKPRAGRTREGSKRAKKASKPTGFEMLGEPWSPLRTTVDAK